MLRRLNERRSQIDRICMMQDQQENRIEAINSPHELALGITFGVIIGLMPKDSAIPWVIGLLFLLSRGNILCGLVAAFGASIASPMLDPASDRLGLLLLSIESLQSTYASWMEIEWIAWTRFNNTVVAGSLAMGVLAAFPVYLLSQVFFRSWGIKLIESFMRLPVIRLFSSHNENQIANPEEQPFVIES